MSGCRLPCLLESARFHIGCPVVQMDGWTDRQMYSHKGKTSWMNRYRIYPCIMRTFFTTFEAEKLRCALYTKPFVSEALKEFMNLRQVDARKNHQKSSCVSGSAKRGVTFQEKWLRIRF